MAIDQREAHPLAGEGEVAIITMDDGKANALSTEDFRRFEALLGEVERSDASAIVLTGRPGYFTAGMNLKLLGTLSPAGVGELVTAMGESSMKLFTHPLPVVSAISGHALGAGAIFSFASDVRMFASGAFRFGLNEVPGGMPLPSFGVEVARASAPTELHTAVVAHGRVFSPEEAVALKIGESLHAPEALLAAALARASGLAGLPRPPYTVTKLRLRGAAAESALRLLKEEVGAVVTALGG
ncbi:MAG: enoyl-CoA hydratase-related protein [Myxococcaceae bacterium]